MRFAVLVFPGSNCDHDAYHAVRHVLKEKARFVWHQETSLGDCDAVIVPGGFSYGDYLRSGAIARFAPIMPAVVDFAGNGGAVLGICNGFQILVEAGLLPGALISNRNLRFINKMVNLRVENRDSIFTSGLDSDAVYSMPIAHRSGNYFVTGSELDQLEKNGQIAFRYVSSAGEELAEANPNGSYSAIAGVFNEPKNVLGLMPHPERAVESITGSTDGLQIFRSMVGKN